MNREATFRMGSDHTSARPLLVRGGHLPPIGFIVLQHTVRQIVRVADVELTFGVLQHVRPELHNRFAQAPRVGLEPTTRRLTAGCSTG